jgi:CubicO group peptidase (beta-lactamase class C family)
MIDRLTRNAKQRTSGRIEVGTAIMATALAITKPEDVGLSSVRLARISAALEREVQAKRLPGAVVGIMREGKLAHLVAVGSRDPKSGAPMSTDTVFSIASMTKAMTSVGIMMLVEEGRVLLADPVSAYLPELKNPRVTISRDADHLELRGPSREPTVQDLLRHTSGYVYGDRGNSAAQRKHPNGGSSSIALTKAQVLAMLAEAPLMFDPGSTWEYGFSTDILGFIVEAVSGQTLGAFLRERLWGPMSMVDTAFELTDAQRARYAHAFATDPLSGGPQNIRHADPAVSKWESGGGGAVSTVADYLRFTDMLRAGGSYGGRQYLGRGTVRTMTSDHLPAGMGGRIADTMDPAAAGYGFGLGFAVRLADGISAKAGSKGDYYWSGVFGTYFWVDPAQDMSCVFMGAVPGLLRLRYRQMVRNLVYQALI